MSQSAQPLEIDGMTPLLQVFSMPRALAFYRGILGFEVVSDSGNGEDSSWVWIRRGGIDLMLNDQYEPGSVPDGPLPERTKWHADTCLYFGADPDAVYEYLMANGQFPKPPADTSYGMRQLHISDPDGYSLCFQRSVDDE